ncbi:MAG: CoA pyrophosphatase [Desulfuromonas sp.]|nr:MAG: CoA pyrophosphatase [Desulfuromonas sp.]
MPQFTQISRYLAAYPARPLKRKELRPAAVLLPLFQRQGQPWILFTRRPAHLKNHGGEISFPGGGVETSDRSRWQTALRETDEEIGVTAEDVGYLGQLDDIVSIYGYLVTPFVGQIADNYPYRPDPGEIDEIIELPLHGLRDPDVYHQENWQHKGRLMPVDFYQINGQTIWGMTAAILKQMLERIDPLFADTSHCRPVAL